MALEATTESSRWFCFFLPAAIFRKKAFSCCPSWPIWLSQTLKHKTFKPRCRGGSQTTSQNIANNLFPYTMTHHWMLEIDKIIGEIKCKALYTSAGVGNRNPLQYSCLENPMDRGVWQATVHGVTNSRTQLSNWTCTHMHTCIGETRWYYHNHNDHTSFCFLFFNCSRIYVTFTISTIPDCSGVALRTFTLCVTITIPLQNFSIFQSFNSVPIKHWLPVPPLPIPDIHHPTSVSVELTTQGTST